MTPALYPFPGLVVAKGAPRPEDGPTVRGPTPPRGQARGGNFPLRLLAMSVTHTERPMPTYRTMEGNEEMSGTGSLFVECARKEQVRNLSILLCVFILGLFTSSFVIYKLRSQGQGPHVVKSRGGPLSFRAFLERLVITSAVIDCLFSLLAIALTTAHGVFYCNHVALHNMVRLGTEHPRGPVCLPACLSSWLLRTLVLPLVQLSFH